MKIYFKDTGVAVGKVKYGDERLENLALKFKPKKVVPFFAEFTPEAPEKCDIIAVAKDSIADIIIPDIDKFEGRLERSADEAEKTLAGKCLGILNDEKLLCDADFTTEERKLLEGLAALTFKPVVVLEGTTPVKELIELSLKKAGIMFFYTVGSDECKAWSVRKGSNALTCAGKIHSDLARGFIRADVVSYEDMMKCFNMHEAKEKGFVKTVEKDYTVKNGDILEIKFNV